MENRNKFIYFFITILIILTLWTSFITFNKNEEKIRITTENFSSAATDLLINWPGLDNPQIFNGNQVNAGKLAYKWQLTSNIISDENSYYYYGFQIIRKIDYQNYINWYCVLEFHPVKQKLSPKNTINYTPIGPVTITDKNLAQWPYVHKTTLLRLKNMEKFITLLKKVKQQTAYLFKTEKGKNYEK